MSAKFACSARHISGFNNEKIYRDLHNYSPLFSLVRVSHTGNVTKAQLGKLVSAQVRFDPAMGTQLGPQLEPRDQTVSHAPSPSIEFQHRRSEPHHQNRAHTPLQQLLARQLQEDFRTGLDTRALVVACGDRVIAEAYGNGITARTRLLGWSMTKSVIAMLFGRMEALGMADPQERDLFAEWSQDARSSITLENLLQMCDGLAFDERYYLGTDATRMLFGNQPASHYALQRPLKYSPGSHFSYSSGSTNLVARWMHKQLGGTEKSLKFLRSEFVDPLALHSLLLETDADGVFVGSSYGFATARDWAKLGIVLLNNGAVEGARVLNSQWIRRAVASNTSINDARYGYQLWLNHSSRNELPLYPTLPRDSYFMLGNREQKLMVCPNQNAVIVRLGWSASPYPAESRFGEILAALPY
ncbi:serine hydrolase [Microbulbifer sp. YPW1]|uniref:serine hydrolase domain-containing protein n=1 Tax=Microbulbifer sp. YPW1 TaxID=2745199 RepID=UPI0015985839|nr:serine hydrolase [Microbulbifer sp. YPW1]QKX18215.1 serine hydrolase [Microbulbifer sp. YPW1]